MSSKCILQTEQSMADRNWIRPAQSSTRVPECNSRFLPVLRMKTAESLELRLVGGQFSPILCIFQMQMFAPFLRKVDQNEVQEEGSATMELTGMANATAAADLSAINQETMAIFSVLFIIEAFKITKYLFRFNFSTSIFPILARVNFLVKSNFELYLTLLI